MNDDFYVLLREIVDNAVLIQEPDFYYYDLRITPEMMAEFERRLEAAGR